MERVTGRRADFLKRHDGSLVAGVSLVERTLSSNSRDRADTVRARSNRFSGGKNRQGHSLR